MVGQRVGVRPARLIRIAISVIFLASLVGLAARKIASQWLLAPEALSVESSHGRGASDSMSQPSDAPHPLDDVLRLAKDAMETHKREHRSYRATVRKRERIGKELGPETRMELKLRYREEDPESSMRRMDVYLKFLEPKSQAGREVIWREGLNDGLMVVHEAGLLNITRLELNPTSRLAMLGNRYPVSDIGIERLLGKLLSKGRRDRNLGECQVRLVESVEVAGRDCKRIEVCHPEPQAHMDGKTIDHEFYRAIIDIDSKLGIPIHYASYLWPEQAGGEPVLDEEFLYEGLELNAALEDVDFDPDNPAYNYP